MIKTLLTALLAAFGFVGSLFGGTTATTFSTATDVATAEDSYLSANGKYLQVLPNDTLPPYETGTVAQKLGKDVPLNTQVIVYEQADKQKGYQVLTKNADGSISSQGFGPQSKERTYTFAAPVATTTP